MRKLSDDDVVALIVVLKGGTQFTAAKTNRRTASAYIRDWWAMRMDALCSDPDAAPAEDRDRQIKRQRNCMDWLRKATFVLNAPADPDEDPEGKGTTYGHSAWDVSQVVAMYILDVPKEELWKDG